MKICSIVCGLLCLLLAGCTNTGILPAGPDNYTLTKRMPLSWAMWGGMTAAEKDALTQANTFCEQKGLKFVPNTMGQTAEGDDQAAYTVNFRCLSPNDPAVAKYQLGQAPNVIVEQRNR